MITSSFFQYLLQLSCIITLSLTTLCATTQANAAPKKHAPSVAEPTLAVLYDQVIDELLRGNIAVFFVPVDTKGTDQTAQPEWWKDCSLSRMISERGIDQARALNRALVQLQLDIQFVESSELCSALSTYTFVIGNNRLLRFFMTPSLNPVEVRRMQGIGEQVVEAQVLSHLQTLLPDSVKILFGFPLPTSVAPHPILSDLAPGESAIFRSGQNIPPVLIARLNWRQWEEMGNYFVAKRTKRSSKTTK
jgi:hypothetical protein